VAPTGTTLVDCLAKGNPSIDDAPADVDFPYGFFSFTITGVPAGGDTSLEMHLPTEANVNTYYKYGPTPTNANDHWYEFLNDGTTGAQISQNIITLYFVDGQRGDDDLASNGMIVDIGGPALEEAESTPAPDSDVGGGGGDGGGGGCFIGTIRADAAESKGP
jgi:hypothetical protein